MGKEIVVTSQNFEQEVLKSEVPVLVDFWADWCVPCRMVAPILEEIAGEYSDKLKVTKINVDEESELASRYSIISIPTMLLFKNGEVVNQKVGAGSRKEIEAIFKEHL
ncbi:MAG: thioredoxin [Spirochaetes bacterium]|nr:MAG: thioredoxin [Spirochaetota bacterium]